MGSHFPHFGEEDCLRSWNGSGTIFFSWCNLRCVFRMLEDTRQIMNWLAREVSSDTYVNVIPQYYPAGAVSGEKYPEINRKLFARSTRRR